MHVVSIIENIMLQRLEPERPSHAANIRTSTLRAAHSCSSLSRFNSRPLCVPLSSLVSSPGPISSSSPRLSTTMANPRRLILILLLNAITTIRVVFSQNYTEIKLKQLDDNKLSFGPIVTVTSENQDEMKCQYYNITTCHGRQQIGCGDTSQICNAPDNSNSTTNMCYALWRNEPLGRRQIISKGCWRGDMTDCRPPGPEFLKYGSAEKCINFDNGRGPPNRTQFCCCYGRECNEEVHSVVVPCHANSTSILCDEELSTVKHHNALLFIAVILFAIIGGLIVYYLICKIWYDKRRKEEEEKSDCSTDDEMSSEVMRSETSDSISILTENWILLTDSITELDKLDLL